MPEGQDPYGSFAYSQRIRKEMLSAINFRRTTKNGIFLPCESGYAPQHFVLSNPITHVDRVVTPVLRSRIASANPALRQLAGLPPSAAATAAANPNTQLMHEASGLPPLADRKDAGLATLQQSKLRAKSAGYALRQPPQAPSLEVSNKPPSSQGSRRSNDPAFVAKVQELESTLQVERENRLRVQRDLAKLEQLLELKLNRTVKK